MTRTLGKPATPARFVPPTHILVVRTYEAGRPILEHRFLGTSQKEAEGIFRAHLQTDSFLSAAEFIGFWRGIAVRNVKSWI